MRKIPTLFQREFDGHRVVVILPELTSSDLSWVLEGQGFATEKTDGACCAILNGKYFKRYDAKRDKHGIMKNPPDGAIPCDNPDPITGHWPHWVLVNADAPEDHWFVVAKENTAGILSDGTYEAVGPHFNSNHRHLKQDMLVRHGTIILDLPDRSFDGIRSYLASHNIEGIVFWKDGIPCCKIKRKDFGYTWPDTRPGETNIT